MLVTSVMMLSLAAGLQLSADFIPPQTAKPQAAQSGAVRTIEIVGTDDMKFSVTRITAKPGERIRIRLRTEGQMRKLIMAHNVVVLKAGVNAEEFNAAAAPARANNFLPPGRESDIIAATGLAGAGETVEVTFAVPKTPGSYDYICTFPGHFVAGMRGTLLVR